jgi:hypothetical protein
MNFNANSFFSALYNVLQEVKFKVLKKEHIDVIIKYMQIFGTTDKILKPIINDIVNISKGLGQTEVFMQYAMALAHRERNLNKTV